MDKSKQEKRKTRRPLILVWGMGAIAWLLLSASPGPRVPGSHPDTERRLTLYFSNRAGQEVIQPGKTYLNPFGEPYTIRNFEYYISDISVEDRTGKRVLLSGDTYLVDQSDSSSWVIPLKSPPSRFSSLVFQLGVDSIKNVSGVQTGALDPYKGMFWTWNTGYICAKLEGTSPAAPAAGTYFTYHIGGYKPGENVSRMIRLQLPGSANRNLVSIRISADANKWFSGSNPIRIATNPVCHAPGELAMKIADNFKSMFTITGVQP